MLMMMWMYFSTQVWQEPSTTCRRWPTLKPPASLPLSFNPPADEAEDRGDGRRWGGHGQGGVSTWTILLLLWTEQSCWQLNFSEISLFLKNSWFNSMMNVVS